MAQTSEVLDERDARTAGAEATALRPRRPDGTSSPAGLIVKIVVLGLVAAIAVWAALPADRPAELDRAGDPGRGHRADLLRLPVAPPDPGEVPDPRHAVPHRLPDRPGALHGVHGVHELRRRPPRQQGGRHRGDRGRLGAAGARLGGLHADAGHRRGPGHRRHRLPADRPGDPAGVRRHRDGLEELAADDIEQSGPTARSPRRRATRCSTSAQASARAEDIAAFSVPTEKGAIKSQGLSRAFEGEPAAGLRRGLRLHQGRRDRPDLDRGRLRRLLRRRARARTWPRAGRSTSGFRNFTRVLTDPIIRASFLRILVWNFAFAIGTVVHHLRARAAGGDRRSTTSELRGPAHLPVADHPAVRHAGVRDAAGLAGHVQHRLRPDQPDARHRHQLVRDHRRARCSRCCWSSCGSATPTCSWSAPARCRRSRPT